MDLVCSLALAMQTPFGPKGVLLSVDLPFIGRLSKAGQKKTYYIRKTVNIGIFLSEFNPYQTYIFCYRNLFINLPHLHHHHPASQEFDNQDAVSCRAHPSNQLPSNPSGIQEQGNNYSKNPNRKSTKTTKRNHRMFGN